MLGLVGAGTANGWLCLGIKESTNGSRGRSGEQRGPVEGGGVGGRAAKVDTGEAGEKACVGLIEVTEAPQPKQG